jgi:hypothetical protein
MPFKVWVFDDVPTHSDYNAMFADAVTADVATTASTTSTSYTALAGSAGPAVTLTLVAGQGCLVWVSARASNTLGGASGQARFSFAVTGATPLAASDANGNQSDDTQGVGTTRVTWFVATATGSHTFTMQYKAVVGGTAGFSDRRIIVMKR